MIFILRIRNKDDIKPRKGLNTTAVYGWIMLLPAVFFLYLIIWRPTVLGFLWSFFEMKGYSVGEFCGFDNYIKVVTHTEFLPILWNTCKYVFWSIVLSYLPPIIIAIIINEMVHFNKGFRLIIYLPAVIPGISAMLIWYYLYYPDGTGLLNMFLTRIGLEPYGWLNDPNFTIIGITLYNVWHGLPGAMLLYYASLQSVSTELYEAAIIDGAGILKRVWHVTRPQIAGTMILVFVSNIIGTFQIMQEPLAMTGGGPDGASISLAYQLYQYGFNSGGRRTGQAMALGVIIFLILIVATIFYFRLNKKVEENY